MTTILRERVRCKRSSDSASLDDKNAIIDRLRDHGIQRFQRLVASVPNILTKKDEELHLEDASDVGMARWGYVTEDQKIGFLRDLLENVSELERRAPQLERKFRSHIENAIAQKWIGRRSVARWMNRLAADNAYYWQKERFIEDPEMFPKFLKNWEKAATGRKRLLSNPLIKKLRSGDVKNLNIFLDEENFLNRPFEERESLVAAVCAALTAKERQMPKLHAKAKYMLEGAARDKALSWSKVGVWMQRIFTGGANEELIDQFINGTGAAMDGKKMTLTRLIANWSEASMHFRAIENKRKRNGTPRGFNFVKLEVFLNWHFEKRKAYLSEADNSFEHIRDQDEIMLKIRHELAAQDWNSAADLIEKANSQKWGVENQRKLRSMELFLKLHRHEEVKKAQQRPTDKEIISEMHFLITQLPPQLQRTYLNALSKGYQSFWVLTTLMYNRVWCHQHNFLNTGKEKRIERQAKEETRERVRTGHKKFGWEANVVKGDTNTRPAVRDQAGVKGAQILYTDERSEATLVDEINEQKNDRNFWYWTSMVPQGVEYVQHLQIVQMLHPRMKKLARMMEERGLRASLDSQPAKATA